MHLCNNIHLPGTNQFTEFIFLHVQRKVQVWNKKLPGKVLSNVRKVYFLLNLSVPAVAPVANKRTVAMGCLLWFPKTPKCPALDRSTSESPESSCSKFWNARTCQNMSEHVRTCQNILKCGQSPKTATWSVSNLSSKKETKSLLGPCHPCRGHPKLSQSEAQSGQKV